MFRLKLTFIAILLLVTTAWADYAANALDSKLFSYIDFGFDLKQIEALIAQGANPNARAIENVNSARTGMSVLDLALDRGNIPVAELLIRHGAKFRPSEKSTADAFLFRSGNGDMAVVDFMMKRGSDINYLDKSDVNGRTPLMLAVSLNREEAIRGLLARGARTDVLTSSGENDLFFAQSSSAVSILIEAKADPFQVNKYGKTALAEAVCRAGKTDVVNSLLKWGGDVKRQAGDRALLEASQCGDLESVKALLAASQKANVFIKDSYYVTPLEAAVGRGYVAVAKLLLERGANPSVTKSPKITLLMTAIRSGNPEMVDLIWKRSPPKDSESEEVVKIAIEQQKPELLRRILKLAGNTMMKTGEEGTAALYQAIDQGNLENVQTIVASGADVNGTHYSRSMLVAAVEGKHLEIVKFLLAKGAKVEKAGELNGFPILHHAAMNGSVEIGKVLIAAGAPVDEPSYQDETALFMAINVDSVDFAGMLIEKGANVEFLPKRCNAKKDPSQTTRPGRTGSVNERVTAGPPPCYTPLIAAVRRGNPTMVKLLVSNKANVNRQIPFDGETALMASAEIGNPEVVVFLLKQGARKELKDNHGRTARDIATLRENTKAAAMLR